MSSASVSQHNTVSVESRGVVVSLSACSVRGPLSSPRAGGAQSPLPFCSLHQLRAPSASVAFILFIDGVDGSSPSRADGSSARAVGPPRSPVLVDGSSALKTGGATLDLGFIKT